jgi:hypothetical protein
MRNPNHCASQSTISRLENASSQTEVARLAVVLLDQFATTVKPGRLEILDRRHVLCGAYGTRITTSAALRRRTSIT